MPCKQSASKEEFLKAIGLDVSKPEDKQKFQMLWVDVTQYWTQHFEIDARNMLKPEYAANPAVHRPWKWAHIDPRVIDHTIQEIWAKGAPWPRVFYDMGHSDDRRVYNWVLKWLLWHVCRYRDWRNRKGRSATSAKARISDLDRDCDMGSPVVHELGADSGAGGCYSPGGGAVGGGVGMGGGADIPTNDYWQTVLN